LHPITVCTGIGILLIQILSDRFMKNLIKLRIFGFFFFGAKDERLTTYQPEISCPSWKNSY